jgi:uncharacterized protein
VATKLPVWEVHKPEDTAIFFHTQLEHLRTDYIDFYLLHALSKERFENVLKQGIIDYLVSEQKAGRIRHL